MKSPAVPPLGERLVPPPISLGLLELTSIAAGYAAADALVKAAPVTLLEVAAVSPGKLCVLYTGGVAELAEAHAAGLRLAGSDLLDELLLPQVHPQVVPLLGGVVRGSPGEALGVLECGTVASGIVAADAAAKAAGITLIKMRRARGIGGKTVILLGGVVADVEVALAAGCDRGSRGGGGIRAVLIPRLHEDLRRFLVEEWGIAGNPEV